MSSSTKTKAKNRTKHSEEETHISFTRATFHLPQIIHASALASNKSKYFTPINFEASLKNADCRRYIVLNKLCKTQPRIITSALVRTHVNNRRAICTTLAKRMHADIWLHPNRYRDCSSSEQNTTQQPSLAYLKNSDKRRHYLLSVQTQTEQRVRIPASTPM